MSYVDVMGRVRWTEADHVAQVEAGVRSDVTHTREHVVIRRMFQMLLPLLASMIPAAPTDGNPDPFATVRATLAGLVAHCAPVTPAQFAEILAAADRFAQADVLAEVARADSARLDLALDFEEARAAVAALADKPHPLRTDFPVGAAGDAAFAAATAAVDADNASTAKDRATRRAAPQAVVAGASPDTLTLVALRDAASAPSQPKAAP